MSNNFSSTLTFSIDTVMQSTFNALPFLVLPDLRPPFRIKEVYWKNPAAVGDAAVVTDGSGANILRDMRCEVANQSQLFRDNGPNKIFDFQVTRLDSGILYITIKEQT